MKRFIRKINLRIAFSELLATRASTNDIKLAISLFYGEGAQFSTIEGRIKSIEDGNETGHATTPLVLGPRGNEVLVGQELCRDIYGWLRWALLENLSVVKFLLRDLHRIEIFILDNNVLFLTAAMLVFLEPVF